MDLQIRRSRTKRRGGRDSHSQRRYGELPLGGGAEFELGREVLLEAGRSGAEGRSLGSTGCGEETGRGLRGGSGKDDGGRADPRISPPDSQRKAESAHGEQGEEF